LKQEISTETYPWNEIVKRQMSAKNGNVIFETQNLNYNENEGDELIQQILFDSLTQQPTQNTATNIDGDVDTDFNQTNTDIDTIGNLVTPTDGFISTVTNIDITGNMNNNDAITNGNKTSNTIGEDEETNENKKK